MRLVTYQAPESTAVGLMDGDEILSTGFGDMLDLIRGGPEALKALSRNAADRQVVRGARLLAPIPVPGKLLFCGVNYASHQKENPAATMPTTPFFFSKLPSAVVGPGTPIVMPDPSTKLDYEVELAVVIGRRAQRLDQQNALDHVFGYTIANDVSARDVQFTDSQITLGKGMDTFCPMGPAIVTADEMPDLGAVLLSTHVNGVQRQSEGTANQLFSVAFLLEFLTRTITLEPGDIVSTGTPAGIGHFRTPPAYLVPGDTVDVAIDAIGSLSNPVIAGWSAT